MWQCALQCLIYFTRHQEWHSRNLSKILKNKNLQNFVIVRNVVLEFVSCCQGRTQTGCLRTGCWEGNSDVTQRRLHYLHSAETIIRYVKSYRIRCNVHEISVRNTQNSKQVFSWQTWKDEKKTYDWMDGKYLKQSQKTQWADLILLFEIWGLCWF
jgi:hypothetical protein